MIRLKFLSVSHFLCASLGATLTSIFLGNIQGGIGDQAMLSVRQETLDSHGTTLHQQRQLSMANTNRKRTVVVYTGPTEIDDEAGKNWIYLANFDYFLEYGIQCEYGQDTILVLTQEVQDYYDSRIKEVREECRGKSPHSDPLRVVLREDRCYDMESLRVVFANVDLSPYEYFVYLNCGIVGPKLPSPPRSTQSQTTDQGETIIHDNREGVDKIGAVSGNENSKQESKEASSFVETIWTERYTSLLDDQYKMSGLSINCEFHPHVQSMMFAVDRKGLEIIRESGSVYDCALSNEDMDKEAKLKLIDKYEIGMSRSILNAGYGIQATHSLGPTAVLPKDLNTTKIDNTTCVDFWYPRHGRFESWESLMFFKSSRMFLLPEIQEEVQYEGADEFDILVPNSMMDSVSKLWVGNADGGDPFALSITIVVSYCSHSLAWIEPFIIGFDAVKVVVFSKCGNPIDETELPIDSTVIQLPNVGRCDHTMAYFMSRVAASIAKTGVDASQMAYVFFKDNYDLHQTSTLRSFHEMLRITSANGFGCFQEPGAGLSQWHKTSVMRRFNMTHYCGVPIVDANGAEHCRFSSDYFKSPYRNMGDWLDHLGVKLPAPYANVCYGGVYAVMASRITSVPIPIWKKLEKSLRRGDNIEEGHFAERLWAALLSKPLKWKDINLLKMLASHVNELVAEDGGGHLGALVTNSLSISKAWRRQRRKLQKQKEKQLLKG